MATVFEPQSSNHIQRVKYDPDTEELQVTFKDASTATHAPVPQKVFNNMVNFGSVGKYYHRVIQAHYPQISRTYPKEKQHGVN